MVQIYAYLKDFIIIFTLHWIFRLISVYSSGRLVWMKTVNNWMETVKNLESDNSWQETVNNWVESVNSLVESVKNLVESVN